MTAFRFVDLTPQGHFRLHFYAALFRLACHLQRVAAEDATLLDQHPFLHGYLEQIWPHLPSGMDPWDGGLHWWEGEVLRWEQRAGQHLPLRAIGALPGVGLSGRIGLMLVGLVEEDSRFGTLFAALQHPLQQRRPSLELVTRLLGGPHDPRQTLQALLGGGFLHVANRDAPRAEWELCVPTDLWSILCGDRPAPDQTGRQYHLPDTLPALTSLLLPDELHAQAAQLPGLVAAGTVRTVVVRGMQGSERGELLHAVAGALGLGALEVDPAHLTEEHLGPLCTAGRMMPILTYDLGPGETAQLPDLAGYAGPVGVLMGMEGGLRGALAERGITLTLPLPDRALRLRHWEHAFAEHAVERLDDVATRFLLPGGHIRRVAAQAVVQAGLASSNVIRLDHIATAARDLNRQMLDTLATRMEPHGSWETLIVSDEVRQKLQELTVRCRLREGLLDNLGPAFGRMRNLGVRALFDGPSGTGKTLGARTLAAVLGMDIYRVDLAAVVNKYIGETEKNLNQVLSRAEELDVILLLDEGDALLAKRSDVKSANDRYANLETNYLLQRLEHYQGIVLITTNAGTNIDSAFQRRMDVLVKFLPPQHQERLHIWQVHLPPEHQVPAAELNEIAARCALTGGQIRNAVLSAALRARESGGPITLTEVVQAVRGEYLKAGAIAPFDATRDETASTVGSFFAALRNG